VRRGEIWLVESDDPRPAGEPASVRPAVVVSVDGFNTSAAKTVVAVPLTTTARGHPMHVEIDDAGLNEISYAQVELVSAVSRARFGARLTVAGPAEMAQIGARLQLLLGVG